MMALEWKTVFGTFGIITLLFLGIPVQVDRPAEKKVELFQTFISKYNRSYDNKSIEYEQRLEHFQESLSRAEEYNNTREHPLSAVYGVTKFSDLSQEEFKLRHLSPNLPKHMKKERRKRQRRKKNRREHESRNHIQKRAAIIDSLPMKVDWRTKGVITPVKNQKTCGACWAFSTVETIESMVAIKNGSLQPLSVQQSVDCATNGNIGCSGGDTCRVLEWMVTDNIGLVPEEQYPFHAMTGTCQLKKSNPGVHIASNFTCDDFVGAEEELLRTVALHGPVAVAVNALNWQTYLGGVIQFHCDGDPQSLNHAVQIVGYDRSADIPFYIVRNSWGKDFGDKGYLYIAIGKNVCGLANEVSAVDVL